MLIRINYMYTAGVCRCTCRITVGLGRRNLHLQCAGSLINLPSQCFHRGRRGWRCGCSSSWMDEGHWPWPRSWGRGQCMRPRTAAEDTTPYRERRQRPACTCCCQAEAAGGRADLEGNEKKNEAWAGEWHKSSWLPGFCRKYRLGQSWQVPSTLKKHQCQQQTSILFNFISINSKKNRTHKTAQLHYL